MTMVGVAGVVARGGGASASTGPTVCGVTVEDGAAGGNW